MDDAVEDAKALAKLVADIAADAGDQQPSRSELEGIVRDGNDAAQAFEQMALAIESTVAMDHIRATLLQPVVAAHARQSGLPPASLEPWRVIQSLQSGDPSLFHTQYAAALQARRRAVMVSPSSLSRRYKIGAAAPSPDSPAAGFLCHSSPANAAAAAALESALVTPWAYLRAPARQAASRLHATGSSASRSIRRAPARGKDAAEPPLGSEGPLPLTAWACTRRDVSAEAAAAAGVAHDVELVAASAHEAAEEAIAELLRLHEVSCELLLCPHVPDAMGLGEASDPDRPGRRVRWAAFELVPGQTLASLLTKHGPITRVVDDPSDRSGLADRWGLARFVVGEVVRGLAAIAEQSNFELRHPIGPQNVWISDGGMKVTLGNLPWGRRLEEAEAAQTAQAEVEEACPALGSQLGAARGRRSILQRRSELLMYSIGNVLEGVVGVPAGSHSFLAAASHHAHSLSDPQYAPDAIRQAEVLVISLLHVCRNGGVAMASAVDWLAAQAPASNRTSAAAADADAFLAGDEGFVVVASESQAAAGAAAANEPAITITPGLVRAHPWVSEGELMDPDELCRVFDEWTA